MVSAIATFCMILVFLLSGRILEAIKRFLMLIVDVSLKILNLFGIKISRYEKRLKMSKEFRATHKDITLVKKSKENRKLEHSINVPALIITVICLTCIVCNVVFDGVIVNWLWEHNILPHVFERIDTLEITFTALTFSILSFSLSKLLSQWKATKNFRIAKKQMKQRRQLLYTMSSKELLDTLKQKDTEIYEKMKADKKDD